VVGYSSTNGVLNDHAVVWSGGTITDLGSAGMDGAEAFGINNLGQVVGYAWTGSAVTHAILWEDGAAIDLNSFLSASMVSQGWVLEHANGINDQGEIVGDAFNIFTSTTQAFLLATAVPEADTYAMLLAGLGLVGWMSRRRKAA
jgi:probable HAF family extracellular repeat protein